MKISNKLFKQFVKEELDAVIKEGRQDQRIHPSKMAPSSLGMSSQELQNKAKGAAMSLIETGKEMDTMPSTTTASEFGTYVVEQANLIMDYLVAMEGGE